MQTRVLPTPRDAAFGMPKASLFRLMPVAASDETAGQRLFRIRRERGLTQIEPGAKTGAVKTVVSDHERGKLRLNADMILHFATALEDSTDAPLQPEGPME
jgi:hypothetical protein